MKIIKLLGFVFVLSIFVLPECISAIRTSANYEITSEVIDSAGGKSNSTNYEAIDTNGQSVIGLQQSANYEAGIGFIYTLVDVTPPDKINNLSANTDLQIKLTWTVPSNEIKKYQIKYTVDPNKNYDTAEFDLTWATTVVVGQTNSKIINGLEVEKTYYFWIRSADAWGNWSSWTDTASAIAGSFEEIIIATGEGYYMSIVWGDYNNDGYLDFVKGKADDAEHGANKMFKNNGNGSFSAFNISNDSLRGIAFGDYDNDGNLDIAEGVNYASQKVYHNNGNDTFGNIWTSAETYSIAYSVGWGDYNNDGKLDLAAGTQGRCDFIFSNNGDGSFTNILDVDIDKGADYTKSIAWGDYDNDGDLDLLTGQHGDYYGTKSKIYSNNGNGIFNLIEYENVAGYTFSVAWGDYDNDGDLDFATANILSSNKVFKNNGNGTFTSFNISDDTSVGLSIAWGDYDNDGRLDLAIGGVTTRMYKNNGNDTFALIWESPTTTGIYTVAWGDYDNDGDLDLIAGLYDGTIILYKSAESLNQENTEPLPPSEGFISTYNSLTCNLEFRWNDGSDSETPVNGLYYNIRVGTQEGKQQGQAGFDDVVAGKYGTPLLGNYLRPKISDSQLGVKLNLPDGTYYWSVQTIDTGLRASQWSAEQTFTKSSVINGAEQVNVVSEIPVTVSQVPPDSQEAIVLRQNLPAGWEVVSQFYDLTPDTSLDPEASLSFQYDQANVDPTLESSSKLKLWRYADSTWTEVEAQTLYADNNNITAQLDHTSVYAIMQQNPTREFVCRIKQSGGDYSSLSNWQNAVHCNISYSTGTKVFSHFGITGSIPDGASVTGSTSGATGIAVHTTSSQILIKNINGSFVSDEKVYYQNPNINFVVTSDRGKSVIATAKIDGSWTTADGPTIISGWTTSEQNYVKIYTSTEARHGGQWDTNKYRISVNTDWQFCIRVDGTDHLKIDGLQLENTVTSPSQVIQAVRDMSPGASQTYLREISNCIIRYTGGTPPAAWSHTAIMPADSTYSGKFKIWNNVLIGWADSIQIYAITSGSTFYIYNNTISGNSAVSGFGIYCNSNTGKSVSLHLKNNIIKRNTAGTACYSLAYIMTGVYNNNISNDATSPNTNYRNIVPVFTSTSSFHLVSTDTNTVNAGIDLSQDSQLAFTTDIDGDTRPAGNAWDIGADEMSDYTAPAAITDLLVSLSGEYINKVNMMWSAPGDNGKSGTIASGQYAIAYSTSPGETWNINSAQVVFSTKDVIPGSTQQYTLTISNLMGNTSYYFRIWTADCVTNWSGISEGATQYFSTGVSTGPVEFVCTIRKGGTSGSRDYATLALWEDAIDNNLTLSAIKVFSISSYSDPTIADGAGVTQAGTGATGTVVHVSTTNNQVLIKSISGTFNISNQIQQNGATSKYVIVSNDGASPIATARIEGSWTTADGPTIISGWTTSAQNYVRIYTSTEARHSGVWDTTKYRISVNTDWQYCIRVDGTDHLKIDGLQIENTVTSPSQVIQAVRDMSPGASQTYLREISNCIIRYTGGTPPAAWSHTAIMPADSTYSGKYKIWNNIITGWCDSIQIYGLAGGSTFYIYNNTINGNSSVSGYGIYCNSNYGKSVSLHLKNNIIKRNKSGSTCYSLAYIMTGVYDNNISNDATSPNTAYRNLSPVFTSTSNFHLVNTDTSAVNAGIDLSQDSQLAFTTDIDGNFRRAGFWDIGADEVADNTAPAAITDLYAETGQQAGKIELTWTAPGNDGTTGNIANGKWLIAYSTYANYEFQITNYKLEVTTSFSPLTLHSLLIVGLTQETTYYFRIWTIDESDNISNLSNGATAWADCPGGYGMFAFVGPDLTFKLGKVYSYPNPAKNGINPIIHAELGIADKVELKIFNVAAELLHSKDISDTLKIVKNKYAYEYLWDVNGIASGVYIYYIKADKAGENSIKVIKKLGLIK